MPKSNLPILKIGAHKVQIILKPSFNPDGEHGFAESLENTITLRSDQSQTQLESSLLHEIGHLINPTLNHVVLDSLFEQIYQVLKDNDLIKTPKWLKSSKKYE